MADYGKLNFSVALNPTSAFPVDARCYFESLAEAQAAASKAEEVGSTNTIYYYGQKLVVVADGIATWYTIQPDKTLKVDKEELGNYYTKTEVTEELNKKQDTLDKYVESVNGYSGKVTLSASDVNALPDTTVIPTVPNAISAFTNDVGYASKTYVSEVAAGKCKAYTFETVTELDEWLKVTDNTANLINGDVFYIREVGVPDYWWDGETQSKQILETTKVDLTDYAKSGDIPLNVSQLTNDAKYTTESQVDTKLGSKQDKLTEYVSSVNGKSGAVTLNCSDVGAMPSNTTIPTALSQLSQNSAYRTVTDTEKATWNAKSDFSGKYNDLSGIPRVTLQGRPAIAGYYLFGTLPKKTDSGNYASFILNGRFGGWEVGNSSYIQIMLLNRNGVSGTVSMSYTASDINQIWSVFDIVISEDTETEIASIYLKCTNYFLYDFEWLTFNGTYLYTGTPVTEEPTNIVWQLSTAPKTMLSSSGVFTASGGIGGLSKVATSNNYNDLDNKPTIPSAYTHPSTHPASMITGLSKVATTNNYNDLNNRPTILSASNNGYNGAITAGGDGVAEMGKYIDFHNTANGTSDYSTRFMCTGEHGNVVSLPSASGTLVVGDKSYKVVTSSSAPTTNDTSVITFVV